MDNQDDPYQILGVSHDASPTQIRSAYRKLALRHHPDKQNNEEERQRATAQFAKISNAYEVLTDPEQQQQRAFEQQQQQRGFSGFDNHDHFFAHRRFHDPFEIFAHVFGEEFGGMRGSSSRMPFENDFFNDPFSIHRGSMFGRDPFMGSTMIGRQRHDPFGGGFFGGGGSMFGPMQRQMEQMQQQMQEQAAASGAGNGGGNTNGYSYYSSSSSSSTRGGPSRDGGSESVTTTTRIINGKRQTVTERTVTNPDGTVERHVETTGDDDFPQLAEQQQDPRYLLGNANNNNNNGVEEEQPPSNNRHKKRRFLSRKKKQHDDE